MFRSTKMTCSFEISRSKSSESSQGTNSALYQHIDQQTLLTEANASTQFYMRLNSSITYLSQWIVYIIRPPGEFIAKCGVGHNALVYECAYILIITSKTVKKNYFPDYSREYRNWLFQCIMCFPYCLFRCPPTIALKI